MHSDTILILVFHSYPTKPCIDGLMATILAIKYSESKIKLVPYWRTEQSFQRLKRTVGNCDTGNMSILYVDCAPDLEQEVEYLLSIIDKVPVKVYDHHPLKKDSPMQRLQDNGVNFRSKFDVTMCGAKMVFSFLLKEKEQEELKIYHDLLHLVHFSDYEGVNDALSGRPKAVEIAHAAFNKAIAHAADDKARANLHKIMEDDMALYYILDNIMAVPSDWKFLYDNNDDDDKIHDKFVKQQEIYLKHATLTVSGEKASIYCEDETTNYLRQLRDMEKKLETGTVLKSRQIGKITADVFVCHIDILVCGRSLEPYVQTTMKQKGASYAVLMNNPTQNKEGEESYYFSLRCINQGEYDARDLATYLKKVSGTKIGGGHAWASGVSLNTQQHRQFFIKEELPL